MRNFFILVFLTFCFIVQLTRLLFVESRIDYEEVATTIGISAFSLFAFLSYKEKYKEGTGQAFRTSYLFLIGFLIVHFQMYIDYLLGNYENFRYDYFLQGLYITKAAIISSIGLISFLIGYLVSVNLLSVRRKPVYCNHNATKYLKVFSVLCFAIFVLTTGKAYFYGGYGTTQQSGISGLAERFIIYSIIAILAIKTYLIKVSNFKITFSSYLRNIGWSFNFFVFLYLLAVLSSGDRGPVIQIALLYFAGFVFSQNLKIKITYLTVLIITAAVFVTFLGELRAVTSSSSYYDKIQVVKEHSENREKNYSFSPSTHELAISVRTVHSAMDYVDKNSLGYGIIQLNQLLAIIPGLGRVIRGFTDRQFSSADLITSHLDAEHGMGTSTITDLYLDLSVPGVAFGLFIFGLLLRKVDVISFTSNVTGLFFWVVILLLTSLSIYIGRSSIMILARDVIIIYFLIVLFGGIKNKQ